jgi:hypothetical protein
MATKATKIKCNNIKLIIQKTYKRLKLHNGRIKKTLVRVKRC